MKNLIVFIAILFLPVQSFALDIFNRSSAAIEYGFDLMETFDDIQDWTGSARWGGGPSVIMSDDFPKRLDGSDTPFNWYDYWVHTDPGEPFIFDHRSSGGHIWDPNNTGVGKSLCMDLSHRGDNGLGDGLNWGPSRLGTVFGTTDGVTGDHTYGYREMYVFFMVFIERNQWPTDIDKDNDNLGTYVEGDPLLYIDSWKFMTMVQGFKAPWIHWQGINSGHDPEYLNASATYGWHANVVHFHPHNEQLEFMYGDIKDYMGSQTDPEAPCIEESHGNLFTGYLPYEIPRGEWIGIEMRYTLNSRGQDDGSEQLWWYEADGTVHTMPELTGMWFQSTCEYDNGDKINGFFIGGNNSDTYKWGPGMNPRYYVDDFIINGTRIGPTYFAKKLGESGGGGGNLGAGTGLIGAGTGAFQRRE